MVLFKVKKDKKESAVSAGDAQDIYDLLKVKSPRLIRLEDGYRMYNIAEVEVEIKRLESEILSKLNGSFIVSEAIPAEYDGEGVEVAAYIPPAYFEVTTETALKASLSSDLLDVDVVVADVRLYYDGDVDNNPTWADFKASFN